MKKTIAVFAAAMTLTALSTDLAFARRGADDPAGHIRQGRGRDDGVGHTWLQTKPFLLLARRGADDPVGHTRQNRGRGRDDGANHT